MGTIFFHIDFDRFQVPVILEDMDHIDEFPADLLVKVRVDALYSDLFFEVFPPIGTVLKLFFPHVVFNDCQGGSNGMFTDIAIGTGANRFKEPPIGAYPDDIRMSVLNRGNNRGVIPIGYFNLPLFIIL